ncbi:MAG: T9SS type A sorting domain-containing protein [Bacteroidales bacterium]|nr:T9SS type A sorting domain-containing protein [Bacteroidales bacterium]
MKKFILPFVFIYFIVTNVFSQTNHWVRLQARRASYTNDIVIRINNTTTFYNDGGWDAGYLTGNNTNPDIWTETFVASDKYSINTIPFLGAYDSLKVGIRTLYADTHYIKFFDFPNIDTNIRMYLRDLLLDTIIDCRVDTVYKFYTEAINHSNRFRFYFARETTLSGGIWNNGLPDSLISARILDGEFIIQDTLIKAYDFKIEPCAALTIMDGGSLEVTRHFSILSDTLNSGSFINKGLLQVQGLTLFEKILMDSTIAGWYISMPNNSTLSSKFSDSDGLWEYNPNTGEWNILSGAVPLIPVKGYVTRFMGNDKILRFYGQLNEDDFLFDNLIRSGDDCCNFGWNLIGNPFPASLSWDLIPPQYKQNLNNAIYFRKLNGQVAVWNGVGTNGGTDIIPPMQAFWVQVVLGQTGGELKLKEEALVHACQSQYKNASKNPIGHYMRVSLLNSLYSDEAIIGINNDASNDFDAMNDAYKLFSDNVEHPQIFSFDNTNKYAINFKPFSEGGFVFDLAFSSSSACNYNLVFSEYSDLLEDYDIIFEDSYENVFFNVGSVFNYPFTSSNGIFNDRFKIHFTEKTQQIDVNGGTDLIRYYVHDNFLNIFSENQEVALYFEIINVLGQSVLLRDVQTPVYNTYLDLPSGSYFITIYSKDKRKLGSLKAVLN